MEWEKIEGIVLHSLPYGDKSRIIKIFSKERGLISLVMKGLSEKKPSLFSLTTPLSHGIYWIRYSSTHDLYSIKEGTLIDDHFSIRKKEDALTSAIEMIQALCTSQMPGKRADALFNLFRSYLQKLTEVDDPSSLSMSFLLKILLHEGLFRLQDHCSVCGSPMQAFSQGECYCLAHAPGYKELFSLEERQELMTLAYCRQFQELTHLTISEETQKKIRNIFKSCQH